MKHKLLNKLWLRVGMIVAVMTTALAGTAWAEDVVAYTLTPASGSNNNYGSNCDITIDGITWNLEGNSQMQPWRIGGKSLTNVNRALYSKTAISDNITKIEVTHGAADKITINSWTVIVSKNSDFSSPVSTLTPTFEASTTTTITRPDGADWSNCYFKFVYNVSVKGGNNRFIEFSEAKFYKEAGSTPQCKTPTFSPESGAVVTIGTTVTISSETDGATIYYTTDGSTPTTSSTQGNTVTITEAMTVKAIAVKSGYDNSAIATASYTIAKVAQPTFSPEAGLVSTGTVVTISSETENATIYYTTDGSTPTTSSTQGNTVTINEETTIKAIAVRSDMTNSNVATATYTVPGVEVPGYTIDFEESLNAYVDWTMTNADRGSGTITAHGGTYYGTTGGKATASFQTKEAVPNPGYFTCFVSKQTTNTTASTWYIQVSENGSDWTDVETQSASSMGKGEWVEFSADLTSYTNVYVRLYYSGSTAVRNVDDIRLTMADELVAPIITVAETFKGSTTATITCPTIGATIKYSFDNETWSDYSSPLIITETTTIYAKSVLDEEESEVVSASTTKLTPITIAEARAQGSGSVYTQGVVTSVNGRTGYIQDAEAAIVVYMAYGETLTVGDEIEVTGTLSTFSGLLEIGSPTVTVLSSGNSVEPEVMTVAQVNSSTKQGWLVKIIAATVTAIESQNVTLTQGESTITVRFNNAEDINFEVNDIITLTGNIGCYNTTQIANPTDVNVVGGPVNVTISAVGYSTLYYSDRNLKVPADVTAYTYRVGTKLEVSHTYGEGEVIPAGTAVVLKKTTSNTSFSFVSTTDTGTADANNLLKGSDEAATTTGGNYYYALTLDKDRNPNSVGFYWMNETGAAFTNGAHKAYLALPHNFAWYADPTDPNAAVKGFIALPDEDDPTAIENVNVSVDLNEGIYNLAGQRLQKMQKGINIVNGKKILF